MNEDLRRLAEAATPGPWRVTDDSDKYSADIETVDVPPGWGTRVPIAQDREGLAGCVRKSADAAYIAALSPDRVLALLDRLAALEGALRRLVDEYDEDMRRSPSFVSIGEARAALAGTPKP